MKLLEVIFADSDSDLDENTSDLSSDLDEEIQDDDEEYNEESEEEEVEEQQDGGEQQQQQQPKSAKKKEKEELKWEVYEDIDPYEAEWLQAFERRPGVLVDTRDYKAGDYFLLFFPKEAFELMTLETNRYADQFFDTPVELPTNSRFYSWKDTTVDEMKAFVALQIAMGLCQKPALPDYWSEYWLTSVPFSSVMSRNRFELLQTFMHFSNAENAVEKGQEGFNPLYKIESLLNIVNPTYEKYYQPKCELAIDESMVKFKGRLHFRQYLPAKPTRWGIKQFVLSESSSGYCLKSVVYTGKTSFERDAGVGLGDQVVMTLVEGYENKGHIIYMDNFYSSPFLFNELKKKNIGACGTVKSNRKGMPSKVNPKVTPMKKGDPPLFMRADDLVACTWHDTKRVNLISTVDTNLTIDKAVKCKTGQGGYRHVEKQVMVHRYNQHMGAVDHLDQMLGSYQYPHKCLKWYHTLYHRAREIALVNGYIIYKTNPAHKLTPKKFREEVINDLLKDWTPSQRKSGRQLLLPSS